VTNRRSSWISLSLRSLAALGFIAVSDASGQVVPLESIDNPSRFVDREPIPNGGPSTDYPRVAEIGPVDDGWVTGVEGLEEITIRFSRPVELPDAAVRVFETPGAEIKGVSLSSDPDLTTHTISFDGGPLTLARVRVVIDAQSLSGTGAGLDGEIFNPETPALPSGDGRIGGQAVFLFNVIAGDANRDGAVTEEDADIVFAAIGSSAGDPSYNRFADFNRDGFVNVLDVAAYVMGSGTALPARDGAPPVATIEFPDPRFPLPPGSDRFVYSFSEPVLDQGVIPGALTVIDAYNRANRTVSANVLGPSRVEFQLEAPLEPGLGYSVSLSNAVSDLSGELLPLEKRTFSYTAPLDDPIFPPRLYPAGLRPEYAARGDLNNDGFFDFVIANNADGTLSVLLGEGDGQFGAQLVTGIGDGPRGFTLDDYDGDGNMDAAVALEDNVAIVILYGDGTGALGDGDSARTYVPTGSSPVAIASGRLDADALPDLAVISSDTSRIAVVLPQPDRSVMLSPEFDPGGSPTSGVIGELTGDGLNDLAVTDQAADAVIVYTGLGDGTFASGVSKKGGSAGASFPVGDAPVYVGIGDLDNDKDLDLYTANKDGGSTTVLRNNRVRGGAASFMSQTVSVGDGTIFVGIGDLDNDKDLDLITANRDSDTVTSVKQESDGSFSRDATFPSGEEPVYVAIADVNGDGEPDLVSVLSRDGEKSDGALVVRLADAEGVIGGQRQFSAPEEPLHVTLLHLIGTPEEDLTVATGGENPQVVVMEGDGEGGFTPQASFPLPARPLDLAVANILGDASRDIIVSLGGDLNETRIYSLDKGGYSLAATLPDTVRAQAINALPSVFGFEIVTAPTPGAKNPSIDLYNLREDASDPTPLASAFVDGGIVSGVVIGDYNGDALPDIAAVGYDGVFSVSGEARGAQDAGFAVFLASEEEGTVTYSVAQRYDLPDDLVFVTAERSFVNIDITPDVLVAANSFTTFRGTELSVGSFLVFESAPDGLFEPPAQYIVGELVGGVLARDFSRDELHDVAVTNVLGDEVAVYVTTSGGGFYEPQYYETHVAPLDLDANDINGDEIFDLAIVNSGSDDITLLIGGTPLPPQSEGMQLDMQMDGLVATIIPDARGASSTFGAGFSGTIEVETDEQNSFLQGLFVDREPQDLAAFLAEASLTINVVDGQVVGGVLSATVSIDGVLDTYTADISASGQIREQSGGVFSVDAITFDGAFSAFTFGGVDVAEWAEDAPLVGAFVVTKLDPESGNDPDVGAVISVFQE